MARRPHKDWTVETVASDCQRWPYEQAAIWQSTFDPALADQSPFRRVTQYTIARTYSRFLAFCECGGLKEEINVTNVQNFARELSRRKLRYISIASQIHDLRKVASVLQPTEDLRWLYRGAEAILELGKTQPKRKVACLRSVSPLQVFSRSVDILTEMNLPERQSISWQSTQRYRDALIVSLGMLIAERRRVLAALTIDDVMAADGFVVSADLMKTNRSSYRHIPPEFSPFIQGWLNLRQHYAADHDWLWIGKGGRPLSSNGIYAAMRSFTEREIGTALTPHRLRDLAATFCVETSPHLARHVRHILGHRHSSTTHEYTETARQIEASRRFAEISLA